MAINLESRNRVGKTRSKGTRMKFSQFCWAPLGCAALLMTACGSGHTIGYAYVPSNPPSGPVVLSFNVRSDNGSLSAASTPGTTPGGGVSAAVSSVVAPNQRDMYVLYSSSSGQGMVVHYAIDMGNGNITAADSQTTGGTVPVALAIDPTGAYLYAVDTYTGSFSSANPGPGDITLFGVSGGTLASAGTCAGTSAGAGCAYTVGFAPKGVTQSLPVSVGSGGSSQLFSFVYVTNSGSNLSSTIGTCYGTISGFQMGSSTGAAPALNGTLSTIDFPAGTGCATGSPYPANSLPVGVTPWAITSVLSGAPPSLPYVYVTDNAQNVVFAYQIQISTNGALPSGLLSNSGTGGATGQPFFATGNRPMNIVADPRQKFLYISNFLDSTISAYDVVSGSGALNSIGASQTAGTGPLCMAIDPSEGKFLYVVNSVSGTVSGFELNGSTGQISPLPNSPFLIGNGTTQQNSTNPACISTVSNGSVPLLGSP